VWVSPSPYPRRIQAAIASPGGSKAPAPRAVRRGRSNVTSLCTRGTWTRLVGLVEPLSIAAGTRPAERGQHRLGRCRDAGSGPGHPPATPGRSGQRANSDLPPAVGRRPKAGPNPCPERGNDRAEPARAQHTPHIAHTPARAPTQARSRPRPPPRRAETAISVRRWRGGRRAARPAEDSRRLVAGDQARVDVGAAGHCRGVAEPGRHLADAGSYGAMRPGSATRVPRFAGTAASERLAFKVRNPWR